MAVHEIHIPRETVNDDFVVIVEWHVSAGEWVDMDQLLVSVETSKSVFEIHAETEGYLDIVYRDGDEAPVGDLIGRIRSDEQQRADKPLSPGTDRLVRVKTGSQGKNVAKISKKAQQLIDKYEIDVSVFAGQGLVGESDVQAYIDTRVSDKEKTDDSPSSTTRNTFETEKKECKTEPQAPDVERSPDTSIAKRKRKTGIFQDMGSSARDRGKSILWLSLNYIWRGWLLRNLARWMPYGLTIPLHRWRGVKIGEGCFIDPTAIIETAYGENITIGNDVRVTANAIVMTHIKAPHYLRDSGIMPLQKKPVVLEDHCFIGVGAIILPGVTVGRAAIVASGAVVSRNVEPLTMVAGSPATTVRQLKPKSI